MPADDSLRAEIHQRSYPVRPSFLEHHPETPVPRAKFRLEPPAFEHGDLVAQGKHLHGQFVLRSEQRAWGDQNGPDNFKHNQHSLADC